VAAGCLGARLCIGERPAGEHEQGGETAARRPAPRIVSDHHFSLLVMVYTPGGLRLNGLAGVCAGSRNDGRA
jgi:hypothetical protein